VKLVESIATSQGIRVVHINNGGMLHVTMEKLQFVESIEDDHEQWELEEVE